MAQEEKTREDRLRDTFNEHFSYERLTVGDIIRLGMFCMDECAKHNLYANHTKLWVPSLLPKHGVRVELIGQANGWASNEPSSAATERISRIARASASTMADS